MTTAAVYVRASLDKTGAGESVERQTEACGALAASRGYTVVANHRDNDVSAKGRATRPAFEALLVGIAAGHYEVVVATELTRLTRNRPDEVRLMDLCRAHGVSIALVRGQDIDLTSASGRLVSEILASVARQEIDQMSERLSSGLRQRAEKGKPHWSARPYGYDLTGALVQPEADRLAKAYADLLDGASLGQIARDLDIPRGTVLKLLKAERNAGLRAFKGEIIGQASWPAIVDESTWRAALGLLSDPARDRGGRTPTYLLVGLAVGPTGETVRSFRKRGHALYAAPGVSRRVADVDDAVLSDLLRLLALPSAAEVLTEREAPDTHALRTERATLVHRRDVELPEGLAAGLSVAQVGAATRTINERVAEIDAALLDDQRSQVFGFVRDAAHWGEAAPLMRAAWDALPLHQRRAVVSALCVVHVLPGRRKAARVEWTPLAVAIIEAAGARPWYFPEA